MRFSKQIVAIYRIYCNENQVLHKPIAFFFNKKINYCNKDIKVIVKDSGLKLDVVHHFRELNRCADHMAHLGRRL